jgi:hypothetical protein
MLLGKTLGVKIFVERMVGILALSMTVVSITRKGDPVKPVTSSGPRRKVLGRLIKRDG